MYDCSLRPELKQRLPFCGLLLSLCSTSVWWWFTLTENCCSRLLCQKWSLIFTVHENTNRMEQGASVLFADVLVCCGVHLSEIDRMELVLSPEVWFATSGFQHYCSLSAVHYIWSSSVRQARQLGVWCYGNECIEMVATSIFRLP